MDSEPASAARGNLGSVVHHKSGDVNSLASRLAAARRFAGLSQTELASRIGSSRSQVAGVEIGRTYLKFTEGWRACQVLGIDPVWLATGRGARDGFPSIENLTLARMTEFLYCGAPFSDVMGSGAMLTMLGYDDPRLQSAEAPLASTESVGKSLTVVTEKGKSLPVTSQMQRFRVRLRKATEPAGKKTDLAAFLGVPRSRVSEWLSGAREPGGETTLRLLHWVEQQERGKP